MLDPHRHYRQTARRVFGLAVIVGLAASGLAWGLIRLFPAPSPLPQLPVLPAAFVLSTVLLALTSGFLERAVWSVRRERQAALRRSLSVALVCGACFTSSQAWGLSTLRLPVPSETVDDSAGVNAFVFLFAILHAAHVTIALMFLTFVTVQAHADRYDHEYYWGVRFCGWFWHALGVLWLVILGAFGLAAEFLRG